MGVSTETIAKYYTQAFETYDKHRKPPEIDVTFYPYVGINHTIRIRNGRVFVRIAEICRDLPASAQRALSMILVAKLYRKRVPPRGPRRLHRRHLDGRIPRPRRTK